MKVSETAEGVPTYWGTSGRRLQMMISAVAVTDFLLFGYDQGVMAGIIQSDAFTHDFPEVKGNREYEGFVVSIFAVGCLLGACFILSFGDQLGRRNSMFLGASTMIIGVVIQICTVGPVGSGATAQFIVGRCITGIGNGINTSTVPTYQAECSKPHNRGRVICMEGGCVAIGSMIAYWIDFGAIHGPHEFVWRFPIAFQCLFAIIVIILTLRLPESPRWLLTKHRHDDAATVVAALEGQPRSSEVVQVQLGMITDGIKASGNLDGVTPFSALLTNGPTQNLRRMLLGASSQVMQQLGGCNAVIYFFPLLFTESIGTSPNLALLLGGVNMIIYAIFATTSFFAVERLGRRKLFLIGTVGQCLSMVLVFGALIPGTESAAKGAAVGLFTYIAFFGATWLPLPWLYPAEINPLKTRAKANALSTVNNWLWNFFIVMITPVLIEKISWGTYLFFAVLNASFFPIIYFLYPETSQRTLEEIDLIFAKGHTESISYVKAAQQLPRMTEAEVKAMTMEYRAAASDDESRAGEKADGETSRERRAGEREKISDSERESVASRT